MAEMQHDVMALTRIGAVVSKVSYRDRRCRKNMPDRKEEAPGKREERATTPEKMPQTPSVER